MQIPQAAFCALEGYRWAFRSALRLHGYRFVKLMQQPLVTPTLQLHGALDTVVAARAPRRAPAGTCIAPYEWRLLDGVGHFPHMEAPDLVARRDPALGEVLSLRAEPRAQTRCSRRSVDLGRRRPALVDAEVELLQAQRLGHRGRPPVYSTRSQPSCSPSTMNGCPRQVQVVRT